MIITRGAHHKTAQEEIPPGATAAHYFDPTDPEPREPQANNFLNYARALGLDPPYRLTGPDIRGEVVSVSMQDWADIVSSATNCAVEID